MSQIHALCTIAAKASTDIQVFETSIALKSNHNCLVRIMFDCFDAEQVDENTLEQDLRDLVSTAKQVKCCKGILEINFHYNGIINLVARLDSGRIITHCDEFFATDVSAINTAIEQIETAFKFMAESTEAMNEKVNELHAIVDKMPNKGFTSHDSHKIFLSVYLKELSQGINSADIEDYLDNWNN
ncbi:hypothetical protein [Photobacterium damselae]|uniref:hypothetical protein n=1 Tax=Photobacterium damselae TaxID=38293 RepID=UPI004067C1A8